MEVKSVEFKQKLLSRFYMELKKCAEIKNGINQISINELINDKFSPLTEFEKFQLTFCNNNKKAETEYPFNFSLFSCMEKNCAIDSGIPPKIVLNPLNSSQILDENSLKYFNLDSFYPNFWGFYYRSTDGNIDLDFLHKVSKG